MGRTGHPTLLLGTAAIVLAATGIGVVLTHGDGPVSKAPTTLRAAVGAELVAPSGRVVAARAGERVPNGYVVRTSRTGSATLTTRGRLVYVEQSAAVAVVDGAHQQLRTGGAVVDAQAGPGLRLDLADDALSVPAGSATEAVRSVSVVIGALHGPAAVASSTGSRLSLPALSQVVVSGDALPRMTTPLHLRDDRTEAMVVPTLVRDDESLDTLARGINATAASTTTAIESSWTGSPAVLPRSAPRSEQVLPMLIAQATKSGGNTSQQRYNRVIGWRRAGGSWGVIVELLGSHAGAVDAVLTGIRSGTGSGQVGTVSLRRLATVTTVGTSTGGRRAGSRRHHHTGSGGSSGGGSGTGGSGGSGSGGGSGTGSGGGSGSGSGGGGTGGGAPIPTPTPTKLLSTVIGTTKGVVTTVLGVLPVKILPTPAPTPDPSSSGGLLGGLLGGLPGGG
jgi:hypothetical protein